MPGPPASIDSSPSSFPIQKTSVNPVATVIAGAATENALRLLTRMAQFDHGKSGEALWEDPDFPATQSSVFYHQTPQFPFEWKRAKEIFVNPVLVDTNYDFFDVVPGKLGDKWMVSCLGILFLNKSLFARVIPVNQLLTHPYEGIVRFRIWWSGSWTEVTIDDRLPTVNGRLAFLRHTHTEQVWAALLEKAYAKLHGSYEALKYGSVMDGLADLTSGIPESLVVPEEDKVAALKSYMKYASIVTAFNCPLSKEDRRFGLECEMNYLICDIQQVDSSSGSVHVIRLHRPATPTDTKFSQLVLDYEKWNSIRAYDRKKMSSTTTGFWMLYSDFVRLFSRVDMVHIVEEEGHPERALANKQKWQTIMIEGSWKKGVTAGGCRNFIRESAPSCFYLNPQLQVVLDEPDTVVVCLNQHRVAEPKVIGFSIYRSTKVHTEAVSAQYFKRQKSIINSPYTNSRQVSYRCELNPGSYLIIPTTYEPTSEASFSLRVFCTKNLKIEYLDFTPQILKPAVLKAPPGLESFHQYEAVFLQLADEDKTIDAFELQELLEACLPNDYVKSCASIDTCRQIVLSMDKTYIGRISLVDFKDLMFSLKNWQTVFKNHARERMGVLKSECFRDALRDIGFVVPQRAMALLVLRYVRKDGMIRFGDFVSAVMHLHRAFNIFYANNNSASTSSSNSGTITLNLAEWLKGALMS